MDSIREAFQRVGKDINSINEELNFLKKSLVETRMKMIEMCELMNKLSKKMQLLSDKREELASTQKVENTTTSTHLSTDNDTFKPLNTQNRGISIRNEGVSTDRQTDRQTDKNGQNELKENADSINNASEILNSLDNIKKEIRFKFKRITDQELLVFSTIYQLEEEKGQVNYRILSKKLNLTESSIRDYVQRLIKKGIPVEKKRINNKTITLNISHNLKKIASLSTILQLRGL
jgi:hypothetical protein